MVERRRASSRRTRRPRTRFRPHTTWPAALRTSTSSDSRTARRRSTGRKAVGEPPLMLALSAFHALRDAIASVGDYQLCAAARRAGDRRAHPGARVDDLRARARASDARLRWVPDASPLASPRDGRARAGHGRARRAARRRARPAPRWSSPRRACVGTIGGGHLEFEALRHRARRAVRRGDAGDAGSCAFRWPRGSASAAAAWRRSRSRRRRCDARLARRRRRALRIGDAAARWSRASAARRSAGAAARHGRRRHRHARRRRARFGGDRAGAAARSRRRRPAPHAASSTGDARRCWSSRRTAGRLHVLVFGNGHVGRALVQVLGALPARVRWIDDARDRLSRAIRRQRRDRRDRRARGRARAPRRAAPTSS